jgi:hypothetical protein
LQKLLLYLFGGVGFERLFHGFSGAPGQPFCFVPLGLGIAGLGQKEEGARKTCVFLAKLLRRTAFDFA